MKQVILVRDDLDLPKGKLASQVAHASLKAARSTSEDKVEDWLSKGGKKIVLTVSDEEELLDVKNRTSSEGLVTGLVKDAGRTVVKSGTITSLAIGPDEENLIDKLTGDLSTL